MSERDLKQRVDRTMAAMTTNLPVSATSISKPALWTGRVLGTLVVLFLLFDGITKVIKEPHVIAASAEFGFSPNQIVLIGAILVFCTVLYAIPRTAILGAILVTGYLGGAVVSQIRVGHGLFECIFPVIFGALAWLALYLREERLRALVSLRS
jgi:DoxX-like family